MNDARLPIVDPTAIIVERDPEVLNAFARGLWLHLQSIRAGGPAEGYPITTIRAAAIWLLERYCDASLPPDYEAVRLVRDLIDPKGAAKKADTLPVRGTSKKQYWAAIAFEASQPADPMAKQPSAASLYAVAKNVRESVGFARHFAEADGAQRSAEATVRSWRELDHYRANVDYRRQLSATVTRYAFSS